MNPEQQREKTFYFLADQLGLMKDDSTLGKLEAEEREAFVAAAGERTSLNDGGRKYYDNATDTMKFETMELDALYEYVEEEILDTANYAWMLHVRGDQPGELAYAKTLVGECFRIWREVRGRRELSRAALSMARSAAILSPTSAVDVTLGEAHDAGEKNWKDAFAERFTWKDGDIVSADAPEAIPPRPDV